MVVNEVGFWTPLVSLTGEPGILGGLSSFVFLGTAILFALVCFGYILDELTVRELVKGCGILGLLGGTVGTCSAVVLVATVACCLQVVVSYIYNDRRLGDTPLHMAVAKVLNRSSDCEVEQ